ncbi:MFS general substrate transporter [Armillaria borealis]|uniref:MFS general substrate transporter n=1 Tax=Armillaria borealis TaxID=47425 RepID=A0AA39MX32_9AGAR|nr:MFS general substrate transporter [Armillaria borealis]
MSMSSQLWASNNPVVVLGFVCVIDDGTSDQFDSKTNSNANTALYSTFAALGFFANILSVNSVLGPKITFLVGSMGYGLYIGSYLIINIHSNAGGFVIAAEYILGMCARLLRTTLGSLMTAYPTETQKGKFFRIFWSIFDLGSVAAGRNWTSTVNTVDNGTYIGFLVLTLIGVLISTLMANPDKMIRSDGTKVTTARHLSWTTEIISLFVTLKTDSNDYPSLSHVLRFQLVLRMALEQRLLLDLLNLGSVLIGLLLDRKSISRRIRAYTGWTVLFLMIFVFHIWGYFHQKQHTRESVAPETEKIDIYDHGYARRAWFYIFCGILDAIWQTAAYWLMGAMPNDPSKLAFFVGLYKPIQLAGAAGIWCANAALLVEGLMFALPMDHTDLDDETIARMNNKGHIRPTEAVSC